MCMMAGGVLERLLDLATEVVQPDAYRGVVGNLAGSGQSERHRIRLIRADRYGGAHLAWVVPVAEHQDIVLGPLPRCGERRGRKSTRLNSSHVASSYAVSCS